VELYSKMAWTFGWPYKAFCLVCVTVNPARCVAYTHYILPVVLAFQITCLLKWAFAFILQSIYEEHMCLSSVTNTGLLAQLS